MNVKVVYVVTSTPRDIYLEQAYVSMLSLRHNSPDTRICLLTDTKTAETFTGFRAKIAEMADELKIIDLDQTINGMQRSRMLKTSVRKHFAGDLLFVDCDTLIMRPLNDIDKIDYDLAACIDSHANFADNPYRSLCMIHGKMLDWPIECEDTYYNSGVILARDTPSVHDFYDRWHANWLKGRDAGVYMDQPSFAKSNYELSHPVKRLDDRWNCELKHGIKYVATGYILHYLCTNTMYGLKALFLLNDRAVFQRIKETGVVDEAVLHLFDYPFDGIDTPTMLINDRDIIFMLDPFISTLRENYNSTAFKIIKKAVLGSLAIKTRLTRLLKK